MPEIGNGIYVPSVQAVYAIIWSFTAFAIVITLLRLYTRTFIVKSLGLDDALILFGVVCQAVPFDQALFAAKVLECPLTLFDVIHPDNRSVLSQ